MLDRRYAVLGWLVWRVGKRMAKRKAKAALPGGEKTGGRRVGALTVVPLLAVAGGAAWLYLRRKDEEDDQPFG